MKTGSRTRLPVRRSNSYAMAWLAVVLPSIGLLAIPVNSLAQAGHSGAMTKPMPSFGRSHGGAPPMAPAAPHFGGGAGGGFRGGYGTQPPAFGGGSNGARGFQSPAPVYSPPLSQGHSSGWTGHSRGWSPPSVNGPGYALPPSRPGWQSYHSGPGFSPPAVVIRPPAVYGGVYRQPYGSGWHGPGVGVSPSPWFYSRGFRHGFVYPRLGVTVPVLGAGALVLGYAGTRWYVDQGIWYQPGGSGYIVAAPPIGAIVPSLPPDYAAIVYGGVPYYFASGVYYVEAPGQGYRVVPAPDNLPPVAAVAPPSNPAPASGPPPAPQQNSGMPELQVIPRAGQTTTQYFNDRSECARAASELSGFDPAQPLAGDARGWERAGTFREYESSCLVARGYDAR